MNSNIIVSIVLEIRVGIKKFRLRCCSQLGLTLEELKPAREPLLRAQFVLAPMETISSLIYSAREINSRLKVLMCTVQIETVQDCGPAIG